MKRITKSKMCVLSTNDKELFIFFMHRLKPSQIQNIESTVEGKEIIYSVTYI